MTIIRASHDSDLPQITAIYAHHVLNGTGSFELDAPTLAEMTARRADVLAKGLPYIVAEGSVKGAADGQKQILGYAYCTWFKLRPAYRFSAEDSVYIVPGLQGKGLGRALLAELAAQAEKMGIRKLIAVIGDSNNAGSIGLHRSVGFTDVGILKSCGWKFDQWLDVVLMEKALGFGDTSPPPAIPSSPSSST
jgi:L-amino acid N-acyltransferase YncA